MTDPRLPGPPLTLFLCGDVMTGRGIDQVLPHPGDPRLHESSITSARRYVELAELANGPIAVPVDFSYVWGDALEELARVDPDVRIINLETSVTRSDDYWRGKGINYRMHPETRPAQRRAHRLLRPRQPRLTMATQAAEV
jgi:poly-gamma-glutamate synthesis protein (capsule biosynthesis protein)